VTALTDRARQIADAPWFHRLVTGVILAAAVLVGIETDAGVVQRFGAQLHWANTLILVVFVVEIAVKMVAAWPRPWRFFTDPWNVFDFVIVAVAFMPIDASYVAVLRLVRLLRVLRLVRALPKLQILVGALIKSIPSMGYVALLLIMLFYVYAVGGVFLFGNNDPVHFGSLPMAFLSLFRVVTGDAWTDLMYIQMYGCDGFGYDDLTACTAPLAQPLVGPLYFVTFVLVGAMVILNLFIGVIMSGMDEAREENEAIDRAASDTPTTLHDVQRIRSELKALDEHLQSLAWRLENEERPDPASSLKGIADRAR
jgi:voltage-gated sodium channel